VAGNFTEVVRVLLEYKADVNARSSGALRAGFTPLHVAAGNGQKNMVILLIQHGANVHAQNDEGLTPYEYASARGFMGFSEWLAEQTY
jgi:ankyrin repeat protein